MNEDMPQMPAKPFLNCESDRFSLFDASTVKSVADLTNLNPVLTLMVGPGNIIESKPLAASRSGSYTIAIQCEDGSRVTIDLEDVAASKSTREGEFLYAGGLDRGNQGLGWIPAR